MKQHPCTPPPRTPPFMLTFNIKGKVKVKLTIQQAMKPEKWRCISLLFL
jgi:hypothetical protein